MPKTERDFKACFRPLPGDLISQLFQKLNRRESICIVSVPFPGILFLNMEMAEKESALYKCFRPLPGDLISQCVTIIAVDMIETGFRPLPGDLISQSMRREYLIKRVFVSVPFPGILFLN